MEVLLANKIERAGRDPRIEKLTLAGRGDIKRFFDRSEEVRARCAGTGVTAVDEEEFRRLRAEVQSLQTLYKDGPFGEGSLFAKALRTIRERELATGNGVQ